MRSGVAAIAGHAGIKFWSRFGRWLLALSRRIAPRSCRCRRCFCGRQPRRPRVGSPGRAGVHLGVPVGSQAHPRRVLNTSDILPVTEISARYVVDWSISPKELSRLFPSVGDRFDSNGIGQVGGVDDVDFADRLGKVSLVIGQEAVGTRNDCCSQVYRISCAKPMNRTKFGCQTGGGEV